jgi:hypothetical protein
MHEKEKEVIWMIAKYMSYISRWFWRAAETVLVWFKQLAPLACERGLNKLQRLQVSKIVEASVSYMRGPAYLFATVLVIYFLATMSLVDLLLMVALFMGFALVLHIFTGSEPQAAT